MILAAFTGTQYPVYSFIGTGKLQWVCQYVLAMAGLWCKDASLPVGFGACWLRSISSLHQWQGGGCDRYRRYRYASMGMLAAMGVWRKEVRRMPGGRKGTRG